MKRFTLVILSFFCIFINSYVYGAEKCAIKDLSVQTSDGFNLKAKLIYPKEKGKKDYKTVVLLHSIGTDSTWWGNLPKSLIENGYAVLAIDLRGHGKSIYNSKLNKVSWKNFTNRAFKKYPSDVIQVIKYIEKEYPKASFFNEWAIVGSDIGASAGIIAVDKSQNKPKTIVIISPIVQTHGLYIPVSVAQLSNVDFLSISGNSDRRALDDEKYLEKFAQGEFVRYYSTSQTSGMVILKNDDGAIPAITEWINKYLKD